MRTQIIQPNGNLQREVWEFILFADHTPPEIKLTHYAFQTKETTRHKWKTQNWWDRYDNRNSLMKTPPYSTEAIFEAKNYFIKQIENIEVKQ